jgi:uncharacterized membrane protein YqgA involved in biofilm formation
MIGDYLKNLSQQTQGNLILVIGLVLLANALDLIRGLNYFIILVATVMVWYGFVEAGYWGWIRSMINKQSQK